MEIMNYDIEQKLTKIQIRPTLFHVGPKYNILSKSIKYFQR